MQSKCIWKLFSILLLQNPHNIFLPYPNFQVHLLSIEPTNKHVYTQLWKTILVSLNVHHILELTMYKLRHSHKPKPPNTAGLSCSNNRQTLNSQT